ncbi:hypothetical protein Tco_0850808, partial [Tanacetum coccineum]
DEIMSISEDDKEVESDKELSIADEAVANKVIDEMLTEINTWVSTSNAFAEHTTKALWAKKNVPRIKPINVQALGTMKKFNQIQISSAPKSDPLGHLPRRMDFLVAHVHNLGKSLPAKIFNLMDSVLLRIVVDALEERLLEFLFDTLKSQLPLLFNALNTLECCRLAILEKSIHKLIYKNVRVTIGEVPNDLLVVNSKDHTTKVNHTLSDMDELVG